ncbi:PAS domain S-box protein [Spirulina sp. CS-785/01]|uniref:PAS domain S-box protein n=1 Tax=Spirulina sp. CS-785/01 TaxID=3021716 RepID=UPI00232F708D|nr:PAS domain S-box protein [Spirulina sp. CS-785/01]MDB9312829.1 PAS domain S-box protein [Spirulina sp. CS-785/01]
MIQAQAMTNSTNTATELQIRLKQQSAVVRLGQIGLTETSLPVLLDKAVQLVAQTLEIKFVKVLELLPNGSIFMMKAGVGWKSGIVHSTTITAAPTSQAGYLLNHNNPVVFEDLRVETRFRGSPVLHNHQIISGAAVLITTSEEIYGVLGVYSDQLRPFTQDDLQFLQSVSHILGAAVEREHKQIHLNLFKRAMEASRNSIMISDALECDYPLIYVNSSFEQLTGYKHHEVLGRNSRFLYDTETDPMVIQELEDAKQYGQEHHAILQSYRKDGSMFWSELYLSPVHDNQGHLTHFIEVQSDISDRKHFEEVLRSERDLLNGIMQTSIAAILVVDAEGKITFANDRAQQVLGFSYSDLSQRYYDDPDWHIMDFEGHPIPKEEMPFRQVMESGKPIFHVGHAIKHPNSSRKYLSINGSPLRNEDGEIHAVVFSVTDITEQHLAETALRNSEEQFRLTFEKAPIGMSLTTLDGQFLQVNQALCDFFGYQYSDLIGKTYRDLTHPDDLPADCAINQQLLLGEIDNYQMEKRYLAKDGQIVHALLQVVLVCDDQGKPSHTIGQLIDITERKRAEEALRESEQRLEGILSSIDDVVWSATADTFNLLYLNPAAATVYGRSCAEFFRNPELWFEIIHPDDRDQVAKKLERLVHRGFTDFEYRITRPRGEIRWLYCRTRLVYGSDGNPLRIDGISSDVTERKRAEAQLRHNAFYDSLTDLPNRALFMDRLWHTIRRSKRRGGYLFAVLFLDLDSFKVINDSLGHTIGDYLLVAIARRLESCLRPSDTLARLGGDEFTVLLEDIESREEAVEIAKTILQQLKSPFLLQGHEVFTNASIGIAFSQVEGEITRKTVDSILPIDYERPEDFLRDADTAMYRAKALGKGRYVIFDHNMHASALARLELETDLRRAVHGLRMVSHGQPSEFLAYYQPILSLKTGKLAGFEALLRWQHPTKGLVSPAKFIPLAEETGLIVPLGEWILTEAMRQLRKWEKQFPQHFPLTMSVNLSGKQIREPELIDQIDKILARTGLESRYLKLEITESMLMDNAEAATEMLLALRSRQIKLSIDDFGTGYSSLSYLHRFPVNTLKIDRSFVKRMQPNGSNSEIVRAIVSLAHNLGMDVVAEGIEIGIQLQQLKSLGCEYGQGYFYAPPLSQEVIEQNWLKCDPIIHNDCA